MNDVIKFRGVIDYTTPDDPEVRTHMSAMFDRADNASSWVHQEEVAFAQMGGCVIVNRVVLRYVTRTSIEIERAW